MSLLERVRESSRPEDGQLKGKARDMALLKSSVEAIVPVDDLAAMVAQNPGRARNEMKSACRRSFEDAALIHVESDRREQMVAELLDEVFGFGPLESMVADASVTEIMVNGPCDVFFEREGVIAKSDQSFSDAEQLRALIDRILGPLGRRIDESSPMVSARLPQGHRVHAVIPPLALDGPVLTIRKFPDEVMSLRDMVAKGSVEESVAAFLAMAVRERRSIAVSGGTGSGKTTLLNALSREIPANERVITIEDAAELRFSEHPHVVRLEARPRNAEGVGEVTIRDLVTNALRMRPDRIVVGECRGAEALDMLQAMNTGHEGSLTTLHANSPRDAVSRLVTMVRYAEDFPVEVIEAQIASAFDFIVQTARAPDGFRFVSHIARCRFDDERKTCAVVPVYWRCAGHGLGAWESDADAE